ncbi:MAG: ASCH domain-containing protein [Methylococcales bacterium]|nr:ASCH domain-containing protein [Methylococcales bacterium]MDD5754819.1 ASCH domain-containing protein [Methylococcales bacterium]
MMDYPEKTCSIERLVTHEKLVAATIAGRKTQQRRNGVYGYPNETFDLEGKTFIVTDLYQQKLGDMTDADAQAEGYPSLEMYRDLILRMHANMEWNDDASAWVHCFKAQD